MNKEYEKTEVCEDINSEEIKKKNEKGFIYFFFSWVFFIVLFCILLKLDGQNIIDDPIRDWLLLLAIPIFPALFSPPLIRRWARKEKIFTNSYYHWLYFSAGSFLFLLWLSKPEGDFFELCIFSGLFGLILMVSTRSFRIAITGKRYSDNDSTSLYFSNIRFFIVEKMMKLFRKEKQKLDFQKVNIILRTIFVMLSVSVFSFGYYFIDKEAKITDAIRNEELWKQQAEEQKRAADEQQNNYQINPEIDIENTIVLCKNNEKYLGKKLISDGVNFQVIEGSIFYKGEELERLCNPDLKEFDYEAEPSFHIFPAYKGEIDYTEYEGETTAEEVQYSQSGDADGYFDGKDINLKLKNSYKEPDGQDHLKNVYLYGYLAGYIKGCKVSNPTSKDCKYAKATLGDMENLSRISGYSEISNNEPVCENEKEMGYFKKPVQITWLASLGGCLSGCEGASFNRLPIGGDFKYPYFAGYFGEGVLKEEFLPEGFTLKISGKWTGIDADYPKLVFDNKCVPIVDIEKIEVVK